MRIYTNTSALGAQTNLSKSQRGLSTAIERLSSGLRINAAKDDAAGLSIANRMTSRLLGQDMAKRNAEDAISLIQTTEGAASSVNDLLQRMRELAVQRATGTNTGLDRASIDTEIDQLRQEINRIGLNTNFGGIQLTQAQKALSIQVGSEAEDSIGLDLQPISTKTLGLDANAIPLGPPLTEITVASGSNAGTWPISLQWVLNNEGQHLYPGEAETYYGVPQGSITLHQVLDLDGNPLQGKYVVKLGDKNYSRSEDAMIYDHATGTATYRINNHFRQGGFYDPENGVEVTGLFLDNLQMGWTTDGELVEYLEYDGHYIKGKTEGSLRYDNNIYASGPNKNTIELRVPNLIQQIDLALDQIDSYRTYLGAMQNRFESVISGLQSDSIALEAARSRIEDADYAVEISNMTRAQILQQAGQAVLAQANQIPQGVLSLIK